jgi:hypothetical protein
MYNKCKADFKKIAYAIRLDRIDHYEDSETIYRMIATVELGIDLLLEGHYDDVYVLNQK